MGECKSEDAREAREFETRPVASPCPIAVIAMACRFPGAPTLDDFWHNLAAGVDSVREIPADRWNVDDYYDPNPRAPGKTVSKWAGLVDGVEWFEPGYFGISPHEAARMDPQQRLLLEVCYDALESAGLGGSRLAGSDTGVFIGISLHDYLCGLLSIPEALDGHAATGNFLSIAANRISYLLDLKGPSMAVDTGCSSSLVALHLAAQSLARGECGLAIVGTSHLHFAPQLYVNFSQAGMLSPDGRSKTFDRRANGYVRGEGVGAVVLKPLAQAVADRDTIRAVIRGTAINQDGHTNGLTAPSAAAQADVLRRAYDNAGVDARSVSYVEAHGTGTALGDPIEVNALARVFGGDRTGRQWCAIGSVKPNIGHLEPASGMAGLLKVILALEHRQIPPQVHFEAPNDHLSFERTPFYVVDRLRRWTAKGTRRAGVSSFGFGGTNAHVVVEEPPATVPAVNSRDRPRHILALSARSLPALAQLAARFNATFAERTNWPAADICNAANTGRPELAHRLAVTGSTAGDLAGKLAEFIGGGRSPWIHLAHVAARRRRRVGFFFGASNNRHASICRRLYETQPSFARTIDQCQKLVQSDEEKSALQQVLMLGESAAAVAAVPMVEFFLFVTQFALAELWRSWGVEPSAAGGVGLGELVAACVAGAVDLDEALCIVARRTRRADAQGASSPFHTPVRAPRIPLVSSVDATVFDRSTPIAAEAMARLDVEIALDLGGAAGAATDLPREANRPIQWVTTLDDREDPWSSMLEALAELFTMGVPIDWVAFDRDYDRRRPLLPTYPYERERYWIAPRTTPKEAIHRPEPRADSSTAHVSPALPSSAASTGGRVAAPAAWREMDTAQTWLSDQFAQVLEISSAAIDRDANLMELGLDSVMATRVARSLAAAVGCEFDTTLLFAYPTVRQLARYLAHQHPQSVARLSTAADSPPRSDAPPRHSASHRPTSRRSVGAPMDIAVIGIACRFPGASSPEKFWDNVCAMRDMVGDVPTERSSWGNAAGASCRLGGFLDGVADFDAAFFGLSLREARLMDPQQRLFLEVTWECLERAGYQHEQLARLQTGVFVGVTNGDYARLLERAAVQHQAHFASGNAPSMVANRVSYLLDFRGPSVTVDTACSSSLVALHMACGSLASGECEVAVAGGVNLVLLPDNTLALEQAGMLATDGRCKTFDDRADGYVRSEGAATVLLKPLDVALRDRDLVLAVIKGTATNHDGHSKAAVTAPNPHAQRGCLESAYARAGIRPRDVSYVEAHGTGTPLGDPIELRALCEVYQADRARRGSCAIASVKSHMGHLESAAGIAGLINVVQALVHRRLPPGLHLESPNRHLSLERTPFYVNDRLRPWVSEGPRRAAVSSFGAGGANAHVVLEEGPEAVVSGQWPVVSGFGEHEALGSGSAPNAVSLRGPAPTARRGAPVERMRPAHVLTLSARSESALKTFALAFAELLARADRSELTNACFTANTGRKGFEYRLAVVAADTDELVRRLRGMCGGDSIRPVAAQCFYSSPADRTVARLQPAESQLANLSLAAQFAVGACCQGAAFDDRLLARLRTNAGTDTTRWTKLNDKDFEASLMALAQLFCLGVEVDWERVYEGVATRRVVLPTYPFERQRCWVEPPVEDQDSQRAELLHQVTWSVRPITAVARGTPRLGWLLLGANSPLIARLGERLLADSHRVARVESATGFRQVDSDHYHLDPTRPNHYVRLLESLRRQFGAVDCVVHAWALGNERSVEESPRWGAHPSRALQSLFYLAQAMARQSDPRDRRLQVVTCGAQNVTGGDCAQPEYAPLWGLARVIPLEQPRLHCQCVDIPAGEAVDIDQVANQLILEAVSPPEEVEVAYRDGHRWVSQLARATAPPTDALGGAIRRGGTYVITGGLGGIGLALANWLSEHHGARLVLTSRRPLPPEDTWDDYLAAHSADDATTRRIRGVRVMRAGNSNVLVIPADVTDRDVMRAALETARRRCGAIHGVFHAAGIVHDGLLAKKPWPTFEEVLRPKMHGVELLDELTRDDPLDFLVIFSSLAAVLGNFGQGDYAAANRFCDSFAAWRTARGRRTLSINWGLWGEVGMGTRHVEAARARGVEAFPTREALAALELAMQCKASQLVLAKFSQPLPPADAPRLPKRLAAAAAVESRDVLVRLFSQALELPPEQVDPARPVTELGVDSVIAAELSETIGRLAGKRLPRTVLFDHATIDQLAEALGRDHEIRLTASQVTTTVHSKQDGSQPTIAANTAAAETTDSLRETGAIAVIGMGGRFPKAATLEQFWANLAAGVDAVDEVPADRWDVSRHYSADRNSPSSTYSKWGALVEDLEWFDAEFFRLSPREVEEMDPQQRLLLEVAWEAIESAGYAGGQLAGSRTGVFVGAMASEYLPRLLAQPERMQAYVGTGNAMSVIANRTSYYLDLKGPCLTIDTACSSSLVAVHLAVASLRRGECDHALAGGTQAGLALSHFQVLSRLGALSPSGRCRAFDQRADGYVLGEGAAVVLLKPLSRAIADGDHICGVIVGSAVNHGGQSAGLTVPSAASQADCIRSAMADAGIGPESISYVEAHGTGTRLGDPIELEGLASAFGGALARGRCAIGTVKSNIGHLEPAAGIAGLVKVLLALEARAIPPTLHCEAPNEQVHFEDTPFYVNDRLKFWDAPAGMPRRAGVSSFGFGGTNAHVVVEEAPSALSPAQPSAAQVEPWAPAHGVSDEPRALAPNAARLRGLTPTAQHNESTVGVGPVHLLALSARSIAALRELANRFVSHLERLRDASWADACYTAAMGRRHMTHRLAVVAPTAADAARELAQWLAGDPATSGVYTGEISIRHASEVSMTESQVLVPPSPTAEPNEWQEFLEETAQRYCRGLPVNWERAESGNSCRRVPLPTYPFHRKRYWVDRAQEPSPSTATTAQPTTDIEQVDGWFHEIVWREAPPTANRSLPRGTWLIFVDQHGIGRLLGERLRAAASRVVLVDQADNFAQRGADHFAIRAGESQDYARVFAECRDEGRELQGIVHLWSYRPSPQASRAYDQRQMQDELTLAVYSARHLLRAISVQEKLRAELWFVTANARNVHDYAVADEHVVPERAALWGYARSARLEFPRIRLACVDVSFDADAPLGAGQAVWKEILSNATEHEVALRGDRRFVAGLQLADSAAAEEQPIVIRSDRVYLITGGLGALGLETARWLTSAGRHPRLVLISRTPLPAEDDWPNLLTQSSSDAVTERVRAVMELRGNGAEVCCFAADVADIEAMRRVIAAVRQRYGRIDGVIHAAGVLRDRLLSRDSLDDLARVFEPKLFGTRVLLESLGDEPCDFLLLYSSMSALAGSIGQASYAAANAYMDALAADPSHVLRNRIMSLNWGPWSEIGMAAQHVARDAQFAGGMRSISRELGRRLLAHAFAHPRRQWAVFHPAGEANVTAAKTRTFLPLERLNPVVDLARSEVTVTKAELDRQNYRRTQDVVRDVLARVLKHESTELAVDRAFQELGVDSIMAEEAARQLRQQLRRSDLTVPIFFAHPTIAELSQYLAQTGDAPNVDDETPAATPARASRKTRPQDIAIIGYACRFPGARDARTYWANLRDGVQSVRPMPLSRWEIAQSFDPHVAASFGGQRPRGGFLDDIDLFDPLFFRISPAEARQMDPRQRLYLETSYVAAEHAGHGGRSLERSKTGVFAGTGAEDYHTGVTSALFSEHSATGGTASTLASRLAYFLNLRGPCLSIDTACSSSLVAVHLAIQSLRSKECDFAFAGAAHLHLRLGSYLALARMGALSADGDCRAFDDSAAGFVPAEGVGVLVLRRLEDALAARDHVYAVLRGSAVNNDGRTNGLTAPNPAAQRDVLLAAWADAEIEPETLSYIEAHGTGTALGDPIEVEAIRAAFAGTTRRRQCCRVGSAKSNLGHCDAAAGMAGMIKVILCLEHRQLAPTLQVRTPNRRIAFENTPLAPVDRLEHWNAAGPRRAGVSAFGFSGTNAHLVIEEGPGRVVSGQWSAVSGFGEHEALASGRAPNAAPLRGLTPTAQHFALAPTARRDWATDGDRPAHLLTLSAANAATLERLVAAFETHLAANSKIDLGDLCFTANTGRAHLAHRMAVVASDVGELAAKLHRFHVDRDRSAETGAVFHVAGADSSGPMGSWIDRHLWPSVARLPAHAREIVFQWASGPVADELRRRVVAQSNSSEEQPSRTTNLHELAEREAAVPTLAALMEWTCDQWREVLSFLARLYVWGADIDWQAIDAPFHRRRIPLPTYPFDRQRYWLHATTAGAPRRSEHAEEKTPNTWFRCPVWRRRDLAPLSSDRAVPTWVALLPAASWASSVVDRLRASGKRVVQVRPADQFRRKSKDEFTCGPRRKSDYVPLLDAVANDAARIGILHMWSCDDCVASGSLDELERRLDVGVRSVFLLAQALAERRNIDVDLRIVTHGAVHVAAGEGCASAEQAPIWGLAKVITQEMAHVRCQAIDLPATTSTLHGGTGSAPHHPWLDELHAPAADVEIAYRDCLRYALALEPAEAHAGGRQPLALRQRGTYLITGGMGGIGRQLAAWLQDRYDARLVLLGRHVPPAQLDAPRRENVWFVEGDVVDLDRLSTVIAETKRRFGQLDGVFHLAGTIRKGLLRDETIDDFNAILRPKVQGTWALDRAIGNDPGVFLVLFSSVAALDGNVFQADYSAANRYLDSFAAQRNHRGLPTQVVHWGLWGEVGMGTRLARTDRFIHPGAMPTSMAIAALERAMAAGWPQVVIAPDAEPLPTVDNTVQTAPRWRSNQRGREADRAVLTRSSGSRTEIVLEALSNVLDVPLTRINRHSSFVDLGMDSMLAVKFVRELERRLDRRFAATLPFDYPSVERLATHLGSLEGAPAARLDSRDADLEPQAREPAPSAAPNGDVLVLTTGRRATRIPRRAR